MVENDSDETATADEVIDEVVQIGSDEVVYVAHHDLSENGLTVTLSLALAAVTDREPATLIPEFSEHVDPDALDRMFRPLPNGNFREGGPLHLHIAGHDIEIHNTGRIEIFD